MVTKADNTRALQRYATAEYGEGLLSLGKSPGKTNSSSQFRAQVVHGEAVAHDGCMHSGCNRACVAVWCPRLDVCCGIAAALHPFQASISRLASGHHDGTRACAAPRNIVPASWGPPPTTVWQGSRASEPTHQVDTVARWNSASADPFTFHRNTQSTAGHTPHGAASHCTV